MFCMSIDSRVVATVTNQMKLWWKPLLPDAEYLEVSNVDPNETVASLISNRLWHQHDAAAQATVKLYRVLVAGTEPTAEEEAVAQQGMPLARRATVQGVGLADGDSLVLFVPQASTNIGVARFSTVCYFARMCVFCTAVCVLHGCVCLCCTLRT